MNISSEKIDRFVEKIAKKYMILMYCSIYQKGKKGNRYLSSSSSTFQ